MSKPVILTGIRSNEAPTIANYLGAFLPIVEMQKQYAGQYQINMFVPDLHSFTTPIDHSTLYRNTLDNIKYFIAAGLDINDPDTFIYRQSYVPAHSELTWILDCFTYVGEMSRMTQFKDKSRDEANSQIVGKAFPVEDESVVRATNNVLQGTNISMGLLNYPVLMAADILLYNAAYIPVGEDQFQHIEITRDIATRFNNKFGDVFTIPVSTKEQTAFIQRDEGLRIRSLTDPTKKMSKSAKEEKSKINLTDTPEEAAKKIMSATTDSVGVINFDWENQPGIANLLQLLSLLTDQPINNVVEAWQGKTNYGELKHAVAEAVSAFLSEFQGKLADVTDEVLLAKLESSERAMNSTANQTLHRAQVAVGLRPRE